MELLIANITIQKQFVDSQYFRVSPFKYINGIKVSGATTLLKGIDTNQYEIGESVTVLVTQTAIPNIYNFIMNLSGPGDLPNDCTINEIPIKLTNHNNIEYEISTNQ